ncbi:MAG: radical SAM protein [Pseudomonadota bacterium]
MGSGSRPAGTRRRPGERAPARKKAVPVRTGGGCNNRCIFCDHAPHPPVTPEDVYEQVARSPGGLAVIEGPGEPTLAGDIARLAHTARRAGASGLAVFTNGRMLSYEPVAKLLADLKPCAIAVSLHGASAPVHEKLTKTPDSFTQALRGLSSIMKLRHRTETAVFIRFVPLKENMDELASIVKLAGETRLDGIVVDGPGAGRRAVPPAALRRAIAAQRRSGVALMTRAELETSMSRRLAPLYSSDGTALARFHEHAGSLSLVVRTGCRNACSFCTTRIIQEENLAVWPLDHVETFFEDIKKARGSGIARLKIVAIEPLEHPDMDRLIGFARGEGLERIEIWTSARALSDAGWARRLGRAGMTNIDVPIMGSRADIHDGVAASRGAFDQTMAGIQNAQRLGIACAYHLIVTKQNMGDLARMSAMGQKMKLGEPASVLIPSPSSTLPASYEAFMPRLSDVARCLETMPGRAAAALLRRGLCNNIPVCVLLSACPGHAALIREFKPVRQGWVRDGDLSEPGARLKLRKKCAKAWSCVLARECIGLNEQYVKLYGSSEFEPMVDP